MNENTTRECIEATIRLAAARDAEVERWSHLAQTMIVLVVIMIFLNSVGFATMQTRGAEIDELKRWHKSQQEFNKKATDILEDMSNEQPREGSSTGGRVRGAL